MKSIRYSPPTSIDSIIVEEDRLPYFYEYLHYHNDLQITLILKGEGTLIIDKYRQRFSAGDIYFINARNPHRFCSDISYFNNLEKKSVHAIHIYFDESKIIPKNHLPEMNDISQLLRIIKHGLQMPNNNSEYVKQQVLILKNTRGFERLSCFLNLLQYFATHLHQVKNLSTGAKNLVHTVYENPRIRDVYDYTIRNYQNNITLKMVSDICSLTTPAFCKFFKRHTSKTYVTFLNETRINQACKKIIQGDYESIATLANACGFNNSVNFNKAFKKSTKLSPSEYIKEHKSNILKI